MNTPPPAQGRAPRKKPTGPATEPPAMNVYAIAVGSNPSAFMTGSAEPRVPMERTSKSLLPSNILNQHCVGSCIDPCEIARSQAASLSNRLSASNAYNRAAGIDLAGSAVAKITRRDSCVVAFGRGHHLFQVQASQACFGVTLRKRPHHPNAVIPTQW